jgi:hypothetical protein
MAEMLETASILKVCFFLFFFFLSGGGSEKINWGIDDGVTLGFLFFGNEVGNEGFFDHC